MVDGDSGAAVSPAERLYTGAAVRELDRRAIEEHGMAGYGLMSAAGAAAFRLLRLRWPGARRLAIACGAGNNGGDGLVLARLARAAGLEVAVAITRAPEQLAGSAARAWQDHAAAGGGANPPEQVDWAGVDVVVDALLGTGLDRAVRGSVAACIEAVNAAGRPVLAVDIPSGLGADSGAVLGTAVQAAATITFIGRKRGLYTGAAPAYTGPIFLASLATPAAIHDGLEPWTQALTCDRVRQLLPRRSPVAHKGQSGRLLVIGGNHGMAGAARLAGEAALRAGAGLVTVATRAENVPALAAARPELMASALADPATELPAWLAAADACVLGPGLGDDEWAEGILEAVFAHARVRGGLPGVIDADGLNGLARRGGSAPTGSVLTPHPGEAGRLLGEGAGAVEADRFRALERLVAQHGRASIVLKGAGTLIGAPGLRTALVAGANPALATGGTGDVLAGLIGGLVAQGSAPEAAAQAGVWLHAAAGERLAGGADSGLIAADLLPAIAHERAALHHG